MLFQSFLSQVKLKYKIFINRVRKETDANIEHLLLDDSDNIICNYVITIYQHAWNVHHRVCKQSVRQSHANISTFMDALRNEHAC